MKNFGIMPKSRIVVKNNYAFYNYSTTGRFMKADDNVGQVFSIRAPVKTRKPGRPRAISSELEPIVVELFHRGHGYRSISNILREEFRIHPHYSSVRLVLKRLGLLHPCIEKPQLH